MRFLSLASAVFFLFSASCSHKSEEAGQDAGMTSGDMAMTAVGACIPNINATGNSLHVGAYCSSGGGQCTKYFDTGGAGICAIDVDPMGDNFCILIGCKTNADCAEKACCTGRPGNPIHACVPVTCVSDNGVCPAVPGGLDGGVPDGSAQDASAPRG